MSCSCEHCHEHENHNKNIISRINFFDEKFLMGLASICALFLGEYIEAIAIIVFFLIGEFLQDRAITHSKNSIKDLMMLKPDFANLKTPNEVTQVAPENVSVNDIIIVYPGEKIPLDGIVLSGDSYIDTSSITGESIPQYANFNSNVLAGCINNSGVLEIKVTKTYDDSTVSKILTSLENATKNKSVSEKFITKFAKIYTPIIVLIAVLVALIPPLLNYGTFNEWIYRALFFLVLSCPCALVISIPLSYFAGIGSSSKKGILVKGSNFLYALTNIGTIVFDKTGTITKGNFTVTKLNPHNISEDELIHFAQIAESVSKHPIAKSILTKYPFNENIEFENFTEEAGLGITAKYDNNVILAGNTTLLKSKNIEFVPENSIQTIVYIAVNDKYIGNLILSDEIRQTSINAIEELKKLGISTVMLTGDKDKIAKDVTTKCSIDNYYANLLPQDKLLKLEEIIENSARNVAFIGDGINDAPAIKRASIGISMGGIGSDAAITAADIVIMTDDISKLLPAIKIAKKTKKVAIENIILSLLVKLIVLIIGIFGFIPIWLAIFADVGVSIIAILNSLRILKA